MLHRLPANTWEVWKTGRLRFHRNSRCKVTLCRIDGTSCPLILHLEIELQGLFEATGIFGIIYFGGPSLCDGDLVAVGDGGSPWLIVSGYQPPVFVYRDVEHHFAAFFKIIFEVPGRDANRAHGKLAGLAGIVRARGAAANATLVASAAGYTFVATGFV